MANRRRLFRMIPARCGVALVLALSTVNAPMATAQGCPPGHQNDAYSGECYVKGSAPTINGVPCVASHLGLCSSFTQNQQPPRRPLNFVAS